MSRWPMAPLGEVVVAGDGLSGQQPVERQLQFRGKIVRPHVESFVPEVQEQSVLSR